MVMARQLLKGWRAIDLRLLDPSCADRAAEVGSAASLTGLPVGPSSELVTRNVWPSLT
jgi:hypothetical protein